MSPDFGVGEGERHHSNGILIFVPFSTWIWPLFDKLSVNRAKLKSSHAFDGIDTKKFITDVDWLLLRENFM